MPRRLLISLPPLAVNEIFGPTFQGEGPSAGRRAWFLRLTGCNLACTWCDTPYTWDWTLYNKREETHLWQIGPLLDQLSPMHRTDLLVITGGEPLLQRKALADLIKMMLIRLNDIEVETNGTVDPREVGTVGFSKVRFNVSPKLANSGSPSTIHPWFLANQHRCIFKFVCRQPSDLAEIKRRFPELKNDRVWIMPEGTDTTTLLKTAQTLEGALLWDFPGWNLTLRTQILLWNTQRGH